MFKNYFKVAFRNLMRNKVYSLINILGLAVGVACCLLIILYIRFEFSYDRFHEDSEQIYRVYQQFGDDAEQLMVFSGGLMGPYMMKDFPEIETYTRIHSFGGVVSIQKGGEEVKYREDNFVFADSNFFDLFTFPMIEGRSKDVLLNPFQVAISEQTALKYFGDVTGALGKTIRLDNRNDFSVSGVFKDIPENSHLQVDLVASFPSMMAIYGIKEFTSWWWPAFFTYVKVNPKADIAGLNDGRLRAFIANYREKDSDIHPKLQSIEAIRLYGRPYGEGTIGYVYIFAIIAFVVMMIACVNFMNLSTARAATRALEVGIRKVVGAQRFDLVRQFMGESFLVTLLAVILGLGLAELFLPIFNDMAQLELSVSWKEPFFWLTTVGIIVIVGLLSGLYPALFLSRFLPVRVLKSANAIKTGGNFLRRSLVVVQFVVSIGLIICSIIIYQQYQFMISKSLGFEQEHLVSIEMKDVDARKKLDILKQELRNTPGVEKVGAGSWAPGQGYAIDYPAYVENEEGELKDLPSKSIIYVDHDFLDVLGLDMDVGRFFSRDFTADASQAFVVNEEALKYMGNGPYLDKKVRIAYGEYGKTIYEKEGKIIGVVKDFHALSLRSKMRPTLMTLATERESLNSLTRCIIKLAPGNLMEQLAAIEEKWRTVNGALPFEFEFAEEELAATYGREKRLGSIFTSFTILALLIACLGLMGLAAFTAQQRTKEIGVRKILGASVSSIILMLNREITWLILIAFAIAVPVSYYLMHEWLQEYPYQIGLKIAPSIIAGLSAFLITWVTVAAYSIRAAMINPAEALRYE